MSNSKIVEEELLLIWCMRQRILEQELRYHDVLDLTMLDEERGERENGIINMFECGAAKRRSSTLSH